MPCPVLLVDIVVRRQKSWVAFEEPAALGLALDFVERVGACSFVGRIQSWELLTSTLTLTLSLEPTVGELLGALGACEAGKQRRAITVLG